MPVEAVVETSTVPQVPPMAVEAVAAAVAEPESVIEPVFAAPVAVDASQPAKIETVAVAAIVPAAAMPAPEPVDLDKALAESGLVLVQTMATAPVLVEEPRVQLGRPRKAKAPAAENAEPLVMVETGK
jgi:ribonuclease E